MEKCIHSKYEDSRVGVNNSHIYEGSRQHEKLRCIARCLLAVLKTLTCSHILYAISVILAALHRAAPNRMFWNNFEGAKGEPITGHSLVPGSAGSGN